MSRQARFRSLFDSQADFVWRTLQRFGVPDSTLDDIGQEVFLVVARRLDEIAPGFERSFLYGTARRLAADARRRKTEQPVAPEDQVLADQKDTRTDPEQALDERRALAALDSILDEMDDDIREAFILFELEGMSKPDVARLLGIPEGTAASRLRRGREVFLSAASRIKARLVFPSRQPS